MTLETVEVAETTSKKDMKVDDSNAKPTKSQGKTIEPMDDDKSNGNDNFLHFSKLK